VGANKQFACQPSPEFVICTSINTAKTEDVLELCEDIDVGFNDVSQPSLECIHMAITSMDSFKMLSSFSIR